MKLNTLSLLSFIMAIALTGCDSHEPSHDRGAEQSHSTTSTNTTKNPSWPTYVVTTDPINAPYEIRNDHGLVEGFDVDLIHAIAQTVEFNVEIVPRPWDGVFDALDRGDADIVISPLPITAKQDERMDFTLPYIYPTRTAYLLPATARRLKITGYETLAKASIAAQADTTNITSLEEDFGAENLSILPVESQYLALTAVTSGKTDAGFGDTAALRYYASSIKDIDFVTITQPLEDPMQAGFAVKEGNVKVQKLLNKGILAVVANGTYRKIAIEWFGDELGNQMSDRTEAFITETYL